MYKETLFKCGLTLIIRKYFIQQYTRNSLSHSSNTHTPHTHTHTHTLPRAICKPMHTQSNIKEMYLYLYTSKRAPHASRKQTEAAAVPVE